MKDNFFIDNLPYNRRLFNKMIFLGSEFIECKNKPEGDYFHFHIQRSEKEIIKGIEHIKIISKSKDVIYFKNEKIHREDDKPAILYHGVGSFWYKDGVPHRDNDLPACIFDNGTKEWHKDGKIHREGKPAIVFDNANEQEWFVDGLRHRENDLPAKVINFEKYVLEIWYLNDKIMRRTHNPSLIIKNSDYKEWYLNGKIVTEEEYEENWLKENIENFKEVKL